MGLFLDLFARRFSIYLWTRLKGTRPSLGKVLVLSAAQVNSQSGILFSSVSDQPSHCAMSGGKKTLWVQKALECMILFCMELISIIVIFIAATFCNMND